MAIYDEEDVVAYETKQGFLCPECLNDLDEVTDAYERKDLKGKVTFCDRCQKKID